MALSAANKDGHLVEPHSPFGQTEHTARDLHALQRFAGGGEDLDRVVRIATRRGFTSEHISLQRIELRGCFDRFRPEG
jgi:hypothetical protein